MLDSASVRDLTLFFLIFKASLDARWIVMSKSKVKSSETIPYHKVIISCACGAEYDSGSTMESIRVDICANCHPFYTGESRILDAEGRVEKFRKKYQSVSSKKNTSK